MKRPHFATTVSALALAIVAAVVVLGVAWRPMPLSKHQLEVDSLSQADSILKGQRVKQAAMAKNYVPFFGSSELSRMDAFHPSVLAAKYHRSYRPFLIGRAGSQSLVQYFQIQSVKNQLKNKRAVFIISPQWFTAEGQRRDAFRQYYSPLLTINWLLAAKPSRSTMIAASRLLAMKVVKSHSTIGDSVARLAKGRGLTTSQRFELGVRQQILGNEDQLFDQIGVSNRVRHMHSVARGLPAIYNFKALDQLAGKYGKAHTTNNRFGLADNFYAKRLAGRHMKLLKGSQTHIDYRFSPEYKDFQLILNEFASLHTNVLFVIPPVNQKWADYTGLSVPRYRQAAAKIKHQLTSQGFNHVADFSRKGAVPYFMQDTIHMGWRGWLALDRDVRPFMAQKLKPISYRLNSKFYTAQWAFDTK
ncbi:poly d-alanine transfer protein dltd [Secundilactobacillus kimchicus JCM 15530]|uniref:Protein DltD n=1 Tax=Secundilactobacillus kimchicus JCM 15530 TaxID=1302272 RepID=A0A0R1HKR4_9LACO|nr:D-alanyl-lipoteichoic acid biosynthesis protein DltD [Secundilactobacillus kimchicus]KRK47078.1 poly d-alanine transfer protein dltd [Secundilactobacillus kimchicus JCM 15530]